MKKEALININFEINCTCQHSCLYCYNNSTNKKKEGNALKILDQLFKRAVFQQLTITGGEPLLSEYLLECVVFARLKGVKVVVITNGSVQNDKLYSQLIQAGVSHFQITLNSSNSQEHNKMVGSANAFENTLRNIHMILDKGGKVIPSVVLTKMNASSIQSTFEWFESLNLSLVILNRYNISKGKQAKQLCLSTQALRKAFSEVNSFVKDQNFIVTSNVCTPHCILNPNDYSNIHFGSCPDDPKFKPLTVDANGDVRLCNHSTTVVGSIFKDYFQTMLYSPYSLSWTGVIPEFCSACDKYEDCKGGCKAASEQWYNDYKKVDPIVDFNL